MRSFLAVYLGFCLFYLASPATIPLHKRALDPDHVPSTVCESMVPHHNDSLPSTEPPPYDITPSVTNASPGETIHVKVTAFQGAKLRGLYMQARVFGSGVEAVGQFLPENLQTNPSIRISNCPPGSENAISYISRDAVESLTLMWKVPKDVAGKIYFRGTFVESFSKFWVNVDSELVTISV